MRKIILMLFLLVFGFIGTSHAVSLPWSTTFNCSDWEQGDALSCDNLAQYGSWTCSGTKTEMVAAGNYSSGGGGKGVRFKVGDGQNVASCSLTISFTASSEVWIRWHMKYPSGFAWTSLGYDKWMYVYNTGSYQCIPEFQGSDAINLYTTTNYQSGSGHGWATVMGGATGDGNWHCYEVHLKTDTDGSDGVVEIWIDETKHLHKTNVDFDQGNFNGIEFNGNQNNPNNSGCVNVDYDDMAISNTGYIGPVGGAAAKEITVTNQFDADLSIDFGGVDINTTSDCIVTVKNDGGSDLTIGTLSGLAAPFTLPVNNCNDAVLGAGASCTCTVRYSPTSVGASTQDTLVIPNDDADENPTNVTCDGSGKNPNTGIGFSGVTWQ